MTEDSYAIRELALRVKQLEEKLSSVQLFYTCGETSKHTFCTPNLDLARRAVHRGKPVRPIRKWIGGEIIED